MAQVMVTLNGRTYLLRCGDGEERRLAELADHVSRRIDDLALRFGQYGDERLLLMAALLTTDEMLDLKSRIEAIESPSCTPELIEPATEFPVAPDAGQPLEAVTAPPMEIDASGLSAPQSVAPDPAPEPTIRRPVLRRGSLEARLAQARVGTPSKTGT